MKKLDISITKAQLKSFSIDAEDGKPVVSATLALMTEGGKVVTSYTTSSHDWKKDKLDIPVSAMPLIGQLAVILERAAVSHCRDAQLGIPAEAPKPIVTDPIDEPELFVPIVIDGGPINLDDIPF